MDEIQLKDILISARQESHRMRHYYLGVEHLFIALLEIRGGLASSILSDHGLATEYVIDAVRRKAGKGSRYRLWTGIPETPRAQMALSIAQDIANDHGRSHIGERDLLIAILEENDNIPTRVLQSLSVDVELVRETAQTREITPGQSHSFTAVEFAPDFEDELNADQLFILRRMFHGVDRIRVDARLTGGFTGAVVLVVTPIHVDDREQASVVVKMGQTDPILDEAQRYERHVKGTLPPLTARLEDRPIAPDTSDLAGLKYTFLGDSKRNPATMRSIIQEWSGAKLGQWLHDNLYKEFGENWWKQKQPYRFEVGREYDWLLPPMLTLHVSDVRRSTQSVHTLQASIRSDRVRQFVYGDTVILENFIVQKVDPDKQSIRLALGMGMNAARPYQIEVRGIDFERDTYYRGEVVEIMTGTIYQTRDEHLMHAVRGLIPDFDIDDTTISINGKTLPNPIKAHHNIMDMMIDGTHSTIHGDLHLGNILIGPNESPLLIDFALTRDGHTVFDWANLEISILAEKIIPTVEESWDAVRKLFGDVATLNYKEDVQQDGETTIPIEALQAIIELRKIAQKCLANPDNWGEYYVSLAISALRAMLWETMSTANRRFMYLYSALAMHHVHKRYGAHQSDHTPTPDSTDFFTTTDD